MRIAAKKRPQEDVAELLLKKKQVSPNLYKYVGIRAEDIWKDAGKGKSRTCGMYFPSEDTLVSVVWEGKHVKGILIQQT